MHEKEQRSIFVECVRCGWCCGYRRDSEFGGCEYAEGATIPEGIITDGRRIPVNEDDECIYLEKLDNGFTRCGIHDKRPEMCRRYNCLTEQKIRNLTPIIEHLQRRVADGNSHAWVTQPHRD